MNKGETEVVLGLLRNALTVINRQKKRDNAVASVKKAIANGSHLGRKKKRNDEAIWKLHDKGFSIRAIAKLEGVSTTAVQRSVVEHRAKRETDNGTEAREALK